MPLQGRPRRLWLVAHRWLGLSLGAVLLVSAVTGTLLAALRPLEHARAPAVQPGLGGPVAASALPWQAALDELRRLHGPHASFTFRPPRQSDETLWVFVRGPRWNGTAYFHPTQGRLLAQIGERERLFGQLFELHSELWSGDTGKGVLTVAALAYLLLTVSGLLLWWPARWHQGVRIKWSAGGTRRLFDLHRVVGAAAGLLVLVCVASGAYMAWRPLSQWVTRAAGASTLAPPAVLRVSPQVPPVPLDVLVTRGLAQWPQARVGYVQVPAGEERPVRLRLRLGDDPHPHGLSSVWLHPRTGEVLASHRWTALDPGARAYAVVYPLHTGEWGGPLHRVAVGAAGVVLAGYGITGVWLWWRRRRTSARPRGAVVGSS